MHSILHKPSHFIYYLSDVTVLSTKYPSTLRKFFRTSCTWLSILVLHYTSHTRVFRNPRQYLVEQNQCTAKQAIGATGVFIVPSAQLSRNGTMEHEAMPDHVSFYFKLPKSIYSDYVISDFSYIIRFSLFLLIAYII